MANLLTMPEIESEIARLKERQRYLNTQCSKLKTKNQECEEHYNQASRVREQFEEVFSSISNELQKNEVSQPLNLRLAKNILAFFSEPSYTNNSQDIIREQFEEIINTTRRMVRDNDYKVSTYNSELNYIENKLHELTGTLRDMEVLNEQ